MRSKTSPTYIIYIMTIQNEILSVIYV